MKTLKSPREIGLMRASGRVVAQALSVARSKCVPGVTTHEINQAVEEVFREHSALSLFKGYPGPKSEFPSVICISINEEVVHGIPGQRQIREGDIVSIDTGCKIAGWCGDSAITVMVGEVDPEVRRLVQITEEVLQMAIDEMANQERWSQVAERMERYVRDAGFSSVENYVGHGIGKALHEEPQIPNFVNASLRRNDVLLEPGLVVAVEPMVNMGSKETSPCSDGWTVVTKDGKPSAHCEHTVAITPEGIRILTELDEQI